MITDVERMMDMFDKSGIKYRKIMLDGGQGKVAGIIPENSNENTLDYYPMLSFDFEGKLISVEVR